MAYATPQKAVLRQILKQTEAPLTAQQIHSLANRERPGIGIATVYRALKEFQTSGEIRAVEIPGATPHYEPTGRHHHFFVCELCGKLSPLTGCLPGVNRLAPNGFEARRHEIVLYGDCAECIRSDSEDCTTGEIMP